MGYDSRGFRYKVHAPYLCKGTGHVLADLVAKFAECPEEVEMGDESLDERLVDVASIQSPPP